MTADRPDWPGPTPRGRAIIAAIRAEMNWQKPPPSEPCEVCQPAAERDWTEWVADQRELRRG